MNFEVLPISDIWLDFTRFTPIEEAICTVENIFSKWSNEPIYSLKKSRFGFQNIYYFLNYIPNNFSQTDTIKQKVIPFPHNAIDLVRSIFGINSPFVFVTNGDEKSNSIQSKTVEALLSIIRPAAHTTKFHLPILIQVSKYEYANYVGFKLGNNSDTFYTSRMEFQAIKSLESLQEVQNTYKESITSIFKKKEIKDLSSSCRVNLKFNEDPVIGKENAHYQCVKFYSFMSNDPVQRFYVSFDFNDISTDANTFFNITNATDICISIKRICSVYSKAKTESLIDYNRKCRSYKSWKPILPKAPDVSVKTLITDLFTQFEEADSKPDGINNSDYLTEKSILKSSPANSLLGGLVEILVNSMDLSHFASIWIEFIKELRRRTDHHEYIPGVGRNGPDLDNCLYYQKLEMLNICIKCMINKNKNPNSDETNNSPENALNSNKSQKIMLDGTPMIYPETQEAPVRTEDQILESVQLLQQNMDDQRQKAILQSDQLKSDMSAFKRANPTAVFEDFVYWYSPADFDPQSKQLSKRMCQPDNVWKELWTTAQSNTTEKSLFDPVAQSELVLDYFESLAPIEVIGDLMPVVLSTIYFDVREITKDISTIYSVKRSLDLIKDQLIKFHNEVENIEGTLTLDAYMDLNLNIFKTIEEAMLVIHCAKSLMLKLNNNIVAVNQLLECGIHLLSSDEERNALNAFLQNVGIDCTTGQFPAALFVHNRHYVLNGFVEEKGNKLQQRLCISDYFDKIIVASTIQERI
ncbi:Rab3 GTPase-activating protein catalytic subunit [Tritrichomonas musculus]|uniref:Rab3 GTPase-activating protein catalytic subunit n=1 Tax=Tritrichomonas musculus TaxID=1915356 RepID=A0ABR2HYB5_9EUKA